MDDADFTRGPCHVMSCHGLDYRSVYDLPGEPHVCTMTKRRSTSLLALIRRRHVACVFDVGSRAANHTHRSQYSVPRAAAEAIAGDDVIIAVRSR